MPVAYMQRLPMIWSAWLYCKVQTIHKSVAMGSLQKAFINTSYLGSGPSNDRICSGLTSNLTPLVTILKRIHYFPISWRKLLLDACRIQAPIWQNIHLSQSYSSLQPEDVSILLGRGTNLNHSIKLHKAELLIFDHAITEPLTASLLSYFVRAESTHHVAEFLKERDMSFNKEFSAAIWYQDHSQVLNYTGFFTQESVVNPHPQMGLLAPRLKTLFEKGIKSIKDHFSSIYTGKLLLNLLYVEYLTGIVIVFGTCIQMNQRNFWISSIGYHQPLEICIIRYTNEINYQLTMCPYLLPVCWWALGRAKHRSDRGVS